MSDREALGRERELRLLNSEFELVSAARPRLVLLTGEPGVGKTFLVRTFIDALADAVVVRAVAEEAEQNVPFAVLSQVLPSGAGSATRDPLVIGAALVDRLGDLQAHGPVCLLVDDAHWADVASLQALLFALRRMQRDRVLTVMVARSETGTPLPEGFARLASLSGREIPLTGLELDPFTELVTDAAGRTPPRAAVLRLWEHTRGNPLYAREVLRQAGLDALSRAEHLLPAPEMFARGVRSRLDGCSPFARRLVSAAAVAGDATGGARLATLTGLASADADRTLDEVVAAGLMVADRQRAGREIRFAHPLVRAAVYQGLGADERRGLHRTVADAADDASTRWQHLAAAADGSDDALAADLTAHASDLAGSLDWVAAANFFRLAAGVSADASQAEDCAWRAVEASLHAGDVVAALATAPSLDPGDNPSPRAAFALGWLAMGSGQHESAVRLLTMAWETASPDEHELRAGAADHLSHLYLLQCRSEPSILWGQRAKGDDSLSRVSAGLIGTAIAGESRAVIQQMNDAEHAVAVMLEQSPDPRIGAALIEIRLARGIASTIAGELLDSRRDLMSVLEAGRSFGPYLVLPLAEGHVAEVLYRLGQWNEARVHAELARSTASDASQVWLGAFAAALGAFVAARRGEDTFASTLVDESFAAATALGDGASFCYAWSAAAVHAHSRGDHAGVIAATDRPAGIADMDGLFEPGMLEWRHARAEALVRVGRLDEAEETVLDMAERAAARRHPWVSCTAARVRGLLEGARSNHREATAAFEEARVHADQSHMPFEVGLVALHYGSFLRRQRQRAAAAEQLRAADEVFRSIGAQPFLATTEAELAACGLHPRARKNQEWTTLTPQEKAVAQLVVAGLTNKAIAQQLLVSVKTVEYHLSNVFQKTSVTSRVQLVAAMSRR